MEDIVAKILSPEDYSTWFARQEHVDYMFKRGLITKREWVEKTVSNLYEAHSKSEKQQNFETFTS